MNQSVSATALLLTVISPAIINIIKYLLSRTRVAKLPILDKIVLILSLLVVGVLYTLGQLFDGTFVYGPPLWTGIAAAFGAQQFLYQSTKASNDKRPSAN